MGDMNDIYEERERAAYSAGKPARPGLVNPLVVYQGDSWWNVRGEEAHIATMEPDYALNLLCYCYEHPLLSQRFKDSKLQDALYKRVASAWTEQPDLKVDPEFIKGLFKRG